MGFNMKDKNNNFPCFVSQLSIIPIFHLSMCEAKTESLKKLMEL
jgi:hypothetical protein